MIVVEPDKAKVRVHDEDLTEADELELLVVVTSFVLDAVGGMRGEAVQKSDRDKLALDDVAVNDWECDRASQKRTHARSEAMRKIMSAWLLFTSSTAVVSSLHTGMQREQMCGGEMATHFLATAQSGILLRTS